MMMSGPLEIYWMLALGENSARAELWTRPLGYELRILSDNVLRWAMSIASEMAQITTPTVARQGSKRGACPQRRVPADRPLAREYCPEIDCALARAGVLDQTLMAPAGTTMKQTAPVWSFGRIVRTCRQERGLTRPELARRCGLSSDYVKELERGRIDPSFGVRSALARALATDSDELIEQAAAHDRRSRNVRLDLARIRGGDRRPVGAHDEPTAWG